MSGKLIGGLIFVGGLVLFNVLSYVFDWPFYLY